MIKATSKKKKCPYSSMYETTLSPSIIKNSDGDIEVWLYKSDVRVACCVCRMKSGERLKFGRKFL